MKLALAFALALAGFGGARAAKSLARSERPTDVAPAPYAPSPGAAPFVTLGYRELGADLLFIRLVGYWGSQENTAQDIASLAEAVVALDPYFRRVYEIGSVAMTAARTGGDNAVQLRAIALLEEGARRFPTNWRFPKLAGQIYLVDLVTDDPAQRRAWDEKGAQLLETAARKPNAPADASIHAAVLQSKFGRKQRAIDSLREILLITNDESARARVLEKLAELEHQDADEIAAELTIARRELERAWRAERPAVMPSMYLLVGKRPAPGFDLTDLATGGEDLISVPQNERLEPLTDPPAAPPDPTPAPPR